MGKFIAFITCFLIGFTAFTSSTTGGNQKQQNLKTINRSAMITNSDSFPNYSIQIEGQGNSIRITQEHSIKSSDTTTVIHKVKVDGENNSVNILQEGKNKKIEVVQTGKGNQINIVQSNR